MKYLCKHPDLELVQVEPTRRTIQVTNLELPGDLQNKFLHFPYTIFGNRKAWSKKTDDRRRRARELVYNDPHDPEVFVQIRRLFAAFSNKPITSGNDTVFPFPISETSAKGLVWDELYDQEINVKGLISRFYQTVFPVYSEDVALHQFAYDAAPLYPFNLWQDLNARTALQTDWSTVTIPIKDFAYNEGRFPLILF